VGESNPPLLLENQARKGYFSLTVGEVAYDDAPGRLSKGLARRPVPIMLLARLAVRVGSQGRGLDAGLLKDALKRPLQAADIAGIRAFAVHAKDEDARRFYNPFGFAPSPTGPASPVCSHQKDQAPRVELRRETLALEEAPYCDPLGCRAEAIPLRVANALVYAAYLPGFTAVSVLECRGYAGNLTQCMSFVEFFSIGGSNRSR
jgi:hypothetical protein